MSNLKQIKKDYLEIVNSKIENKNVGDLIKISKNIILQLGKYIEGSYNGYFDKANIIGRFYNGKVTTKELKREANYLIRAAKKETSPIVNSILWAVIYAITAVRKEKNFPYVILFMLLAINEYDNSIDLKKVINDLKI